MRSRHVVTFNNKDLKNKLKLQMKQTESINAYNLVEFMFLKKNWWEEEELVLS
jgi:hypothetical protein